MKQYNFEDSNLPKVNPNENLETISRNFFRPMFGTDKFEIRSETERDKGIDFYIELKKENIPGEWVYTNYKLAIQLKASDSVKANRDGSFSLQIESSNINYLLNNAMPAFYVFFHKPTQTFYYENVRVFLPALHQKDPQWSRKEKHTMRFSKKLDPAAIQYIYEQTYANGILLRQVNQFLKTPAEDDNLQGILIDHKNEVHSAAENIEYIDQYGAHLINKHQFNHIIEIEQNTHPRQEATPRFNLFCGIAYYQRGDLYKAMDLLKIADQHSESFDPNMQAALAFTLFNGKYLLGIISKQEFNKEMQKLTDNEHSGTYFQMEKAYSQLCSAKSDISGAFSLFCDIVKDILKKEDNNELRIIAYSKVVAAESTVLLNDLVSNFCYFIGRVRDPLASKTYLEWLALENRFLTRIDGLVHAANKYDYQIGIANLIIFRIKWNYEKAVHQHYLSNWNLRFFDLSASLDPEIHEQLLFDCSQLEKIAESYDAIEFRENMLSCYLLEYQILHFLRNEQKAEEVRTKIIGFTNTYEFAGLQKQYESIFNGSTAHQQFVNRYTVHINHMLDFATKNGIDMYSSLDSDNFIHNPIWTIKHFFEFSYV